MQRVLESKRIILAFLALAPLIYASKVGRPLFSALDLSLSSHGNIPFFRSS